MPIIWDVVTKLASFCVLNTVDAKSGFWQIALTADRYKYTAFLHPTGLSAWTRVAFELKNGPAHFQRQTNYLVKAAHISANCSGFVDDFAVGGKDDEESLDTTDALFTTMGEYNYKLGADKVMLAQEEAVFLGYLIKGNSILPDPSKVAAIAELLPPKSKT